jgi:hypothetical protein
MNAWDCALTAPFLFTACSLQLRSRDNSFAVIMRLNDGYSYWYESRSLHVDGQVLCEIRASDSVHCDDYCLLGCDAV